jgi:hypothetical protein
MLAMASDEIRSLLAEPTAPELEIRGDEELRDAPIFADLLRSAPQAAEAGDDAAGAGAAGAGERRTQLTPIIVPTASSVPTLELRPGGVLDDRAARLLVRVVWDAVRRGQSAVELRLRPEHLGGVQLHVRVEGDRVYVRICAESAEVARQILAARQELADGLARWRLTLAELDARDLSARDLRSTSTVRPRDNNTAAPARRSFIEVVA